jgi:ferrous iron transport protein B
VKTAERTRRIALIGNPNTGKTTIFNRLTGFRARVGNYAGVTVERKAAPIKGLDAATELIDLPGAYSIAARSPDEMVTVDVLLGNRQEDPEPPDVVLIVADASNLERNMFLASQVMETGLPFALLLNMMDIAETNGVTVDAAELERRLGAPVFTVVGTKGSGLDALRTWLERGEFAALRNGGFVEFPPVFEEAVNELAAGVAAHGLPERESSRFLLRRALLETGGMAERRLVRHGGEEVAALVKSAREKVEAAGARMVSLEAKARYTAIRRLLDGVRVAGEKRETTSDRIDRFLLQPVWGTLAFVVVMLLIFQAIYSWSAPLMDLIDGGFGALGEMLEASLPPGPLASFLVGGVIAGVGGVLVFLPQILMLFLFIAILEDCGYLARAAFLADRLFSRIGLSGRSFIPLLGSFACAIPSVMATRTISDRRERFVTIMVAPLMSCSARLPVYTLMIAAFIPSTTVAGFLNLQGLVLFAMYLVGPIVAVGVTLLLRMTVLKGPKPVFLMELPPYRLPDWRVVFHRLMERAGLFVKKAGTVILAVSLLIWAASYYPRPAELESQVAAPFEAQIAATESAEEVAELEAARDQAVATAYLRQSVLGRMGRMIEPVVMPLGWDWRIGMAVIASFPAREVVVATLGVIFEVGSDADESSSDLQGKLQTATWEDGRILFTIPVAVSIMVFFALCAQCAATLAVIKRETNSWGWPVLAFAYMTTLAWLGAFVTYHGLGALLG